MILREGINLNKTINKNMENNTTFEEIKHIDKNGHEYWNARELQTVLDYKEWRKFEGVINKTKKACINSNIDVLEHFVDIDKTIKMPKSATKKLMIMS